MKLCAFVKGFPGHPLHPPLTDVTIGLYAGATAFGVLSSHGDYVDSEGGRGALVLTLVAYSFVVRGSWLGGAVVFTHGTRVLNLVDEPMQRAVTSGHPGKESAEP